MFGRRLPKNRKFEYKPLYYDPKKEEQQGHRVKFKRSYHAARIHAKQRSLIWMLVLAGLVFLIFQLFIRWIK